MAGFVEALLLAGAYGECVPVIDELHAAAARTPAVAPDACREAIDGVAASSALKEATEAIGDQTAEEFAEFCGRMVRRYAPAMPQRRVIAAE